MIQAKPLKRGILQLLNLTLHHPFESNLRHEQPAAALPIPTLFAPKFDGAAKVLLQQMINRSMLKTSGTADWIANPSPLPHTAGRWVLPETSPGNASVDGWRCIRAL